MLELNRIYNESCLDTMLQMKDDFIDLTVTSPPYDNLRTYGNDIDKVWNESIWKPVIKELYRVTKIGGVVVWIAGDATISGSETGTSFRQVLYAMECGFNLHDTMIYSKEGFAFPSNNRYHQTFEYMFILSKGIPKTFNPIKDRRNKNKNRGGDCSRQKDGSMKRGNKGGLKLEIFGQRYNIWHYKIGGGNVTKDSVAYKHPAIFPEKLAEDHIISWSNEGDIVYDSFAGSGTTLKMALLNNRNYIGSEISKEYCGIAKERINDTITELRYRFDWS